MTQPVRPGDSGGDTKQGPRVYDAEVVEIPEGHGNRREGTRVFTYSVTNMPYLPLNGGCMGPAITFALFLVCLGQFGALAAIGFAVFYLAGSILGAIAAARALMAGRPFNPWGWRVANWVISMLLVTWLAGGLTS